MLVSCWEQGAYEMVGNRLFSRYLDLLKLNSFLYLYRHLITNTIYSTLII